jgi:ferritin-like metal-binding protein YciE
MSQSTAGDAKLIQYLNEAYAMETHLETALQAHIAMTTATRYRQRLKEHLSETKRHGREVKQRVKKLGGTPQTVPAPGPDLVSDAAGALLGGAEKAIALAQGPLNAVRGTGQQEKQLKNAKAEYASEAQEIATYQAIETLAEALGDKDTQQLARTIRRDEKRMLSFLEREIPRQTKAVVNAEIPRAGRARPARKRRAARKAPSGAKAPTPRSSSRAQSRTKAATSRSKATSRATASTRAKASSRPKASSRAKTSGRAKVATRSK